MTGMALFCTILGAATMAGWVMKVVDVFEHPKNVQKKNRSRGGNARAAEPKGSI